MKELPGRTDRLGVSFLAKFIALATVSGITAPTEASAAEVARNLEAVRAQSVSEESELLQSVRRLGFIAKTHTNIHTNGTSGPPNNLTHTNSHNNSHSNGTQPK
jgi:hypothetical protein